MSSVLPSSSPNLCVAQNSEESLVLRQSTEGEWELVNAEEELPLEVKERMEVIQSLMTYRGTDSYGKKLQQAAQKLGVSTRSVQRLLKSWQEKGLGGLSRQMRSDHGAVRTNPEWQQFITRTYVEGNRGSCSMRESAGISSSSRTRTRIRQDRLSQSADSLSHLTSAD
jgi:hypothetical protein